MINLYKGFEEEKKCKHRKEIFLKFILTECASLFVSQLHLK